MELLSFSRRGAAIAATSVSICLSHPVVDSLRARLELPGQVLGRPAGMDQFDELLAI
jgi:hypothetical protein